MQTSSQSTRVLAAVRTLVVAIAILSSLACQAQTTVALKAGARVEPDSAIKVSDIASVTGDNAETLGAIVLAKAASSLATNSGGWFEYSLADLRAALEAEGVNLGRTTLRGATCTVRTGAAKAPAAHTSKDKEKTKLSEPTNVPLEGAPTVRSAVAITIARHLAVENVDLRLGFDPKDEAILSRATSGHRVDVQPAASSDNHLIPVRIYVYAGDRLLASDTLSVRALVRRTVLTAAQSLDRKRVIDSSVLITSESWVSPSDTPSCTLEQAVGATPRNRIGVGQVVTLGLIETPVMVKKGDIVQIHCLSGSITLKATRARALANGREGEYIKFQLEDAKKSFTARVSGRGLAILNMDDSNGDTRAEAPAQNEPEASR